MAYDFDLITLGGGSGGLATTVRAAEYGAKCLLLEPNQLGGTCVNEGCVPKKIMWYASMLRESLQQMPHYGLHVELNRFDWRQLVANRQAYIDRVRNNYQSKLANKGIALKRSAGHLKDAHHVRVGDEVYSAERILIATGGRPNWPDWPGRELAIDSDGFFELEELPAKVAVIGGGYIAVELAGMLASLGSDVTIIIRKSQVLRSFDAMLRERLAAMMQQAGILLFTDCSPERLQRQDDGRISVHCSDGKLWTDLDRVILAIGRDPNTDALGCEQAGLKLDEKGYIPVDDYQRTNVDSIFAVGDVTGRPALTPVAIAAGRYLADRLWGGKHNAHLSYDHIPTVIFSHPAIATMGLSEADAKQRHGEQQVRCYQTEFTPMRNSVGQHGGKTTMKLVCVGEQQRIVGLHIIGLDADEMLQGFAVALTMGATKADFDRTLAIHPTSAEELVTLK